jgi:hypothetical protein
MAEVLAPSRGDATNALLKRAARGDESCLPELRALFADGSRGEHLVNHYGSPAAWLESDLTDQASGSNLAIREAAETKLAKVRAELAGPNPTAIERLLAERAAICWFLVNRYESVYALAKDLTIRQAEYHQARIDRAHKRFLSALKTLAMVRKLALPAIQFNVAEQQINVSGPG